MVSKGSAPQAPDPVVTSQAQGAENRETAIANANLNRIDQYTPYGSSKYDVIGQNDDGTPKYQQTTTLSPTQQQLFDLGQQGAISLGNTAVGQLGRLGDYYSKPFDTSLASDARQQQQDAAYKKNTQYLDPQFAQDQKLLDSKLANQGLSLGGEAYDNAQGDFGRRKEAAYSDARNSAITQGNQAEAQYMQQLFALRNQPLNEYNALTTGTQIGTPQFQGVPGTQQANTDIAGITNSAYQNQLAAYNASQQGINNLFSLGGSLGSAAILASDRRLKRDIKRVGTTASGIPTYTFRYKNNDEETYFGVMSDDVRHIPGAVVTMANGYDGVNYSVLGGYHG